MNIRIRTRGLDELIRRMDKFPDQLNKGMEEAMGETLLVMTENIPGYPPPPTGSEYRRTGTLGRTLGSSAGGGKAGTPSIYTVTQIGGGWEGRFGTNLEYAPYVIGDKSTIGISQAKQHQGRWWLLSSVAEKAMQKIERTWQRMADAMAKFLEGK